MHADFNPNPTWGANPHINLFLSITSTKKSKCWTTRKNWCRGESRKRHPHGENLRRTKKEVSGDKFLVLKPWRGQKKTKQQIQRSRTCSKWLFFETTLPHHEPPAHPQIEIHTCIFIIGRNCTSVCASVLLCIKIPAHHAKS